jgi:hypothetical protein
MSNLRAFTVKITGDEHSSDESYTITRDDGHELGDFDVESLTKLKEALDNALKEATPQSLSAESAGLEPRFAGGFRIGEVHNINGPNAVLMDFKPTRAELETLAYHYLDRHYVEDLCHRMGYSGSSEWREYEYTWKRFRAIEDVLSPDKEYRPFTAYIQKKKQEVDEDLVDAVKTIGFDVMPWEGTIRLSFLGRDYDDSSASVHLTEETFRELLKANPNPSERMVFKLSQEKIDELARQTAERIAERKERVRQTAQRIAETVRMNTEENRDVGDDEDFLRALEEMEHQQDESESNDTKRDSAQ